MEKLKKLYNKFFNEEPKEMIPLTGSGSNRQYFRILSKDEHINGVIGVIGTSQEENRAFYNLCVAFATRKLPVPMVYGIDDDGMRYLQQDLGDTSLFDMLKEGRSKGGEYDDFEKMLISLVMTELPRLQMEMASPSVYNLCYPLKKMDNNSIMFDLNYFKYCFLKLKNIEFNELKLQNDFDSLAKDLLDVKEYGFQYRDFQARNVMMFEGKPFYIDFQGGRCGPVHYDLASFLWQASSKFSDSLREEMVDVYLDSLNLFIKVDKNDFKANLNRFVLFRTLQVLGAYGFRGLWERKQHFIDSIPSAISNLKDIIEKGACEKYGYLKEIALKIVETEYSSNQKQNNSLAKQLILNDTSYCNKTEKPLVVRIFSFSYKKGIPDDESGNGGGYVFDCRSTHNPGRYEQYKKLTGLDQPVIDFLEQDGEIVSFLDNVYKLADFHVNRFMERGFTNLMFAFGCTGGQHRSVYSAQHLAEHINKKFGIEVHICHREQNINQTLPEISKSI